MRGVRLLSNGLTPVVVVACLVAMGAWLLRHSVVKRAGAERLSEQMGIATTEVRRGEFEVAVEAMGRLESVEPRPVLAEVSGQVIAMLPNGVEVKEGDIIAELDVPRMLRELRRQDLEYRRARDELESKKRELGAAAEKAQIKLDQAGLELEKFTAAQGAELTEKRSQKEQDSENLGLKRERFAREKKLADEGLVPGREIELGTAEVKAGEFSLEKQIKDLELAEAETSSEKLNKEAAVTKAEGDLARAKSKQEDEVRTAGVAVQIREKQLARVQEQVANAVIRAPADGIVLFEEQGQGMLGRRPLQPGDQVWEGHPVATIPDLDNMQVGLELTQEESAEVKRGQEVVITAPGLPGKSFPGEVTDVAQTGRDSMFPGTGMPRGERAFPVRIQVKDRKGAPLRPGMTALVRIIVERIPEAVSVPLECVFERDDQHIVYVRRGGDFRAVEVELGAESDDRVMITKGLKGGEEVALRDVRAADEESGGRAGNERPSALPL